MTGFRRNCSPVRCAQPRTGAHRHGHSLTPPLPAFYNSFSLQRSRHTRLMGQRLSERLGQTS